MEENYRNDQIYVTEMYNGTYEFQRCEQHEKVRRMVFIGGRDIEKLSTFDHYITIGDDGINAWDYEPSSRNSPRSGTKFKYVGTHAFNINDGIVSLPSINGGTKAWVDHTKLSYSR